jgi:hypothetical protein
LGKSNEALGKRNDISGNTKLAPGITKQSQFEASRGLGPTSDAEGKSKRVPATMTDDKFLANRGSEKLKFAWRASSDGWAVAKRGSGTTKNA